MEGDQDRSSSPEDTRTRLVRAAREIFARDGYRGATVRAITKAVGVNVGAVAYHFGSKENLYHEVLRDVLTPLQERVLKACRRSGPPRLRLEAVIRAVLEHLLENPDQPRFMVGVRMEEERFPPAAREILLPVLQALVELIQEGQEAGLVREAPPILLALSLLSQPVYFGILVRRAPQGLLPIDPESRAGRATLLDHMVAFALGGLSQPAAPNPAVSDLPRRGAP